MIVPIDTEVLLKDLRCGFALNPDDSTFYARGRREATRHIAHLIGITLEYTHDADMAIVREFKDLQPR
jgi:hypothetical protein